jgi:hypothetical protein
MTVSPPDEKARQTLQVARLEAQTASTIFPYPDSASTRPGTSCAFGAPVLGVGRGRADIRRV